jgi:pSer/pThr/pTyr-binding forkhead associated (FHA) protein
MPALAVNALKVLFVVVIYGFLWIVTRAVRSHLATAAGNGERPAASQTVIAIVAPTTLVGRVLTVARPTLVGRGADCDESLDDPFISDRHVRFDRIEGRLVVEDLGSTNGTQVNGLPVKGRRTLDRGDEIRVGQTIMEVR